MITRWFWALLALLVAPANAASEASSHGVIGNIAVCIVSAGLFATLVRRVGLPPLLGYLLGGVAVGPLGLSLISDPGDIHTISEIGLILLLFMIGMEMDLHQMFGAGRWVIVPGLLQFPVCVGLSFGIMWLVQGWLPGFAASPAAIGYLAVALGLSSTMIVVKILHETREINSLAGRISVGILIFQDLWAIIVLALQPELANPNVLGIAWTFFSGVLLVIGTLLVSRYVLPFIFRSVDNQPELILVLSLGWCFLVSLVAAHPSVGLSMEMGALIAGVSLGTFPYSHDVTARAVSLRDFFITLFFVALGMQIGFVDFKALLFALLLAVLVVVTRFATIYAPLVLLKAPSRAGISSSVFLSQMSEFSLVILAIAASLGHIGQDVLGLAVWVFAFGAVGSGLLGQYAPLWQRWLHHFFARQRLQEDVEQQRTEVVEPAHYQVLFLGLGRIGSAFLEEMRWYDPEFCKRVGVIDFNLKNKKWLEEMGVRFHYGDLAHPVTYQNLQHVRADVVVSGIPDAWLKGSSNVAMLKRMQQYFPNAYHIANTSSLDKAEQLYVKGAHHVLIPEQMAGHALSDQVRMVLERAS